MSCGARPQLLKGLSEERAVLKGAEIDITDDHARKEFFCRWNACVVPDQAIGDGLFTDIGEAFQNFKGGVIELPDLFTRDAEPVAADIMLRPDIERCGRCGRQLRLSASVLLWRTNARPLLTRIPHFIRSKLGRFEIYAGGGQFLHADRDYMSAKLKEISGKESRQAFIYRQLYQFTPCRLLQGGKAFVDAPGTGDKTPLHRGHLKVRAHRPSSSRVPTGGPPAHAGRTHDARTRLYSIHACKCADLRYPARSRTQTACEDADHVIAVAKKQLGVGDDTLEVLAEFGVLRRFLLQQCKLTVLHNHETDNSLRGVAVFCDGRSERQEHLSVEQDCASSTLAALMGQLMQEPAFAQVAEARQQTRAEAYAALRARVIKEVRIQAVYPLTFASLTINPEAVMDQLHDGERVESVLLNTYGAKLLGLLEGLNLERVSDPVSRFVDGPLTDARVAVSARLLQAAAYTGSEVLHDSIERLRRSRRNVQSGPARQLRRTMYDQFEPVGDNAPRGVLQRSMADALRAFRDAVRPQFDSSTLAATAAWQAMRDKFCAPAGASAKTAALARRRALEAYAAPTNGDASPRGMDLEDKLLGTFTLTQTMVDTLVGGVTAATDACSMACCGLADALLLRQLEDLEPVEQVRAAQLLDEFRDLYGLAALHTKVNKSVHHIKLTKHKLTLELNKLKKRLLLELVCALPVRPSAADPAGVATLVDARLPVLCTRLLADFMGRVQALARTFEADARDALRTEEKRSKGSKPRGVELYFNGACEYLSTRCDPERHAGLAARLGVLAQRGDEVHERATQVLANLRAACEDPAALDRAAARYLRMLILQRNLYKDFPDGGNIAPPGALCDAQCVALPCAAALLRDVNNQYDAQGDRRGMPSLTATLAALPPGAGPLVPVADAPAGATPHGSLWRALSALLFDPVQPVNEHKPDLLRACVLTQLLKYYAPSGPAARFQQRHGVSVQEYVAQQRDGTPGAGLLELHTAALLYGVQLALWVAPRPGQPAPTKPLLASPFTPPTERAYALVLEHSTAAGAGAGGHGTLHSFWSTARLGGGATAAATSLFTPPRPPRPPGDGAGASGSGAGPSGSGARRPAPSSGDAGGNGGPNKRPRQE
jgi:hypothetical protein